MSEEHHVHPEEDFCNGISETHELIVINCSSAVLKQIHNFEETTIKKKSGTPRLSSHVAPLAIHKQLKILKLAFLCWGMHAKQFARASGVCKKPHDLYF